MLGDSSHLPGDWDQPGALTIVVQGGLAATNIAVTALHCRHWRALFPTAQIILAISVAEVFSGDVRPGILTDPPLADKLWDDSACRLALATIMECCDIVVLSEGDLPLPPIKLDVKTPNNVNLQIAAAKAGLAQATGRYVLRVRSDLVFSSRNFIEQFISGSRLPRGASAVFEKRVLISPLYTLNPFTFERLPFHYSDWFHFGATADVRKLWDVPPISYADATYYKFNEYVEDSLLEERLFVMRIAVEQHLSFHCFSKLIPNIRLNYHNDLQCIGQSVDILVDNFIVCDLKAASCVFDKYSAEFDNSKKAIHCVTPGDWFAMAEGPPAQRSAILEQKHFVMANPHAVAFPRTYPSQSLSTQIGARVMGGIGASGVKGVLIHGPYDALPRGQYLATLHAPTMTGVGSIGLRVTLGGGREIVAERHLKTDLGPLRDLQIAFDVDRTSSNFEVVCNVENIDAIVVSGLTVAANLSDTGAFERVLTADSLSTEIGTRRDGKIVAASADGVLVHGPYHTLTAGRYVATLHVAELAGRGSVALRITLDGGRKVASKRRFEVVGDGPRDLAIPFELTSGSSDVEIVAHIEGIAAISVSGVTFTGEVTL